ncbi:MAG: restriction endonuclease subunit S [Vulcanibacillus sp.]
MKLSEVIKLYRPTTTSRIDLSTYGTKCIHYGDIYKMYSNKVISSTQILNSFTKKVKQEKIIKLNAIIFPDVTESVSDFGHFVYIEYDGEAYINGTHTFAITSNKINLRYLFYYLQSNNTRARLKQLLKGDTVFQLSFNDMLNLDISNAHSIAIQQHIVDIIT